jgi:hypothetical protein
MSIKFEALDPRGRKVVCTVDRWNEHILRHHPFMEGWEAEVQNAIEHPYMGIYQDAQRADRNVYYQIKKGKERYIKVVVRFDERGLGEVITAFTASNLKPGEKLIWPESSL